MEENWIKIYSSADFLKSEMVHQTLIDNQIQAVLINKQGFPYSIGEAEVFINKEHFQKASEIILKNGFK